MLSAKEARKIAGSELMHIMNLIRNEAYCGGFYIKLGYTINKDTIKVLSDYGYLVEEEEIPIYIDTPYGQLDDKPNNYKKETTIRW